MHNGGDGLNEVDLDKDVCEPESLAVVLVFG